MRGTDRNTGQPLSGLDHLSQSIIDLLSTPYGSRIGRRTYGSRIFSLIDAPLTAATLNDLYQAAAEAIIAWEPRLTVTQIKVRAAGVGKVVIDVIGTYRPTRETVTVSATVTTAPEATASIRFAVTVDGVAAFVSTDTFPLVSFGTVQGSTQKTFVLTNTSAVAIVLRSLSADGAVFVVSNLQPVLPAKLKPGESISFAIACANNAATETFTTLRWVITAVGSTINYTAGLTAIFGGVAWIAYDDFDGYADGPLDAPAASLGWAEPATTASIS